jgi:hypothetical protein
VHHLVDVRRLGQDRNSGATALSLTRTPITSALPGLVTHTAASARLRDLAGAAVFAAHA